jgi:hypothetical protein
MDGGCTVCIDGDADESTAEPGRPTLYEFRVSMFIQIAGMV